MEKKYKILDIQNLKEGQIGYIPLSVLKPTQPDDNKQTFSREKPIEVTKDKKNIIIIHGNHRYYRNLEKDAHAKVLSKVVKNPYSF